MRGAASDKVEEGGFPLSVVHAAAKKGEYHARSTNISDTFPRISRNIETTPIRRRFSFSPSMRVHVPRSSSYFLARARGLLLFPTAGKEMTTIRT